MGERDRSGTSEIWYFRLRTLGNRLLTLGAIIALGGCLGWFIRVPEEFRNFLTAPIGIKPSTGGNELWDWMSFGAVAIGGVLFWIGGRIEEKGAMGLERAKWVTLPHAYGGGPLKVYIGEKSGKRGGKD